MTILECFEVFNDEQIRCLLVGKMIEIKYKDGTSPKGMVTSLIKAAQADDLRVYNRLYFRWDRGYCCYLMRH